ncbi:MAG: DUF4143 domain-containing protein [Treponema sp.]|nr:DUF4143 domain-containing protein [Treponema sp.]
MERFALKKLVAWKNSDTRKPLLFLGARQVGKTWLLKEFGQKYFEKTAYFKFDNNARLSTFFDGDYNVTRIIPLLELEAGFKFDPENTLLIFDEIQICPRAITSLKYFCEDAREYCIAAAGSMLGVEEHKGSGWPVGKIDKLLLYPMSFSEFMVAGKNELMLEPLKNYDKAIIKTFMDKYTELLKNYYFVGGMPEVVQTFIDSKDYFATRKMQESLLDNYKDDFSTHAPAPEIEKIYALWDSIPVQLAKERKTFIYKEVLKGGRTRTLADPLRFLTNAGLCYKIPRVQSPGIPLDAYKDDAFKLFFLDVGLLGAKSNLSPKTLLDGNQIFKEFKGALAEEFVLQEFKAYFDQKLFYWSAERSANEIDFLIQDDSNFIPIEVKSEQNLKAKSLKAFCQKYKPQTAVRLSLQQPSFSPVPFENENGAYRLCDIPLFAIENWQKFAGEEEKEYTSKNYKPL